MEKRKETNGADTASEEKAMSAKAGAAPRGMKLKTYGVKGMMELEVDLHTGSPKEPYVRVAFTGGQITGYGVSPARYSTIDPLMQRIIESSDLFDPVGNNGRVYLISTVDLTGGHEDKH